MPIISCGGKSKCFDVWQDQITSVRSYSKSISVVGISKWITECSVSSTLLGSKRHTTIPNGLDPDSLYLIRKRITQRRV